jgi:hypothetical protein
VTDAVTDDAAHRLKLKIVEAYDRAVQSCRREDWALFQALVAADDQDLPHWSAVSREG